MEEAIRQEGNLRMPPSYKLKPEEITVLEQWMDLDQSGGVAQMSTEEGDTLTFGDQPFTWKDLDAAAGEYIVGFIVEDLDGNPHPVYEQVTVE